MSSKSDKPNPADALKNEACVVAIVHFVDGNKRSFYSGDVRHRGEWKYKHTPHWLQYWKHRIENETPAGWTGRVLEGAIFENHSGHRGKRLAQFTKGQGWIYD